MKFHTHSVNGWIWISNNSENRLDWNTFKFLVIHLKKTFAYQLQYHEDQPVYTYNVSYEVLQHEINKWLKV